MAGALGTILFAYIFLVFLVNHRISMMQCNPMSRPGAYQSDIGDMRFSGSHVQADGSHHYKREQPNIRHIRFEPSYLDFYEKSVGMPSIRTVSIINPHSEQALQLQSISGSTVHFHASFFQSKVVQPLGNTTFEIVFLARLVGNVENTLFIHTSKGVYPYQVFGVGAPNPYRLRPFLGARVPLNFSFSTLINMHNPFSSPLQEIPPYETKALMRVSFIGRIASNHTAFIRIKASLPAPLQELLILPIEVEVTSAPGLFSSADLVDFGTLRTMDEPKSIGLYLLNAGHKQVHISAITIEPPNSALSIGFTPTLLKPGSKYMKVAVATYSAFQVKRSRQTNGKIVIKTNSKITPKLEIPYQVNILQGTIAYSVSKTRFFVGKPPFVPVTRKLPITNTFSFTMVIYDAVFPPEVDGIFSVVNFSKPVRIPPEDTVAPFYIQFIANGSDKAFSTVLRVYTNASIFTVPIHCYNGKLKYAVGGLEEDVVDYGTVGTAENRTKLLKIFNYNPIEVTIHRIDCNLEFGRIKLLESKAINDSKLDRGNNTPSTSLDDLVVKDQLANDGKVSVKAGFVTHFSVEVSVPKQEGKYISEIKMDTDYEGVIVNCSLTIVSTFSNTLKLLSVHHPSDNQFSFQPTSPYVQLLPYQKIEIGHLFYDPSKGCKNHCYTGIEEEEKWLSSFALTLDVGELDAHFIEKNQKKFSSLERSGNNKVNVSFTVDTDVVKGFQIPAEARLSWPSFTFDKPVQFPLTHVGNSSIKVFMLQNPADVPIVVQVVPLNLFDSETHEFDPDESTFSIPTNEVKVDDQLFFQ
ncbi:Transmembrane protein 131 [Acropora cervicornis]|uniref:Transmembrane protein 131 n=1 Tax=Acropora cervicornis TaxID=6130 RepID=A0AAD9Q7C9_ACRCE|nr:Transmembrane protein 131 [Acropora cervicornis]